MNFMCNKPAYILMYLSQLFLTWQLIFHGLHDQSNFVLRSSLASLLSVQRSKKEIYVNF